MNLSIKLVRKYFEAYATKDREILEQVLSDDFTYSSPVDDKISRKRYLAKCWPDSETHHGFHIQRLFEKDGEVFVTYECQREDGAHCRNAEFFKIKKDKIRHVTAYFGAETGRMVHEAEIRDLLEDLADAWRNKDSELLVQQYAPEVLVFGLASLRQIGADEIEREALMCFSLFEGEIRYSCHELIISAGDEVSFCHCLNQVEGMDKQGRTAGWWWRETMGLSKWRDKWVINHIHCSIPSGMEGLPPFLGLKLGQCPLSNELLVKSSD